MNKTHGLVASAWMLGSGLLLNVSLIAQAQDNDAAPEEYYAPQRSKVVPAKKAPGMLPSIIRNADTSKSGSVVRPIGTANNSLNAGRKINSLVSLPSRPANRSAVVPAALQQNDAAIQPVIEQSDAAASPIQKQLEDLYRKDGRPMPQMNFSQTPVPPAEGSSPPNVVAPSNVIPPKPRTFLDKINPFSRNRTPPATLPQHPAKPIPTNAAVRVPQKLPSSASLANGVNPAGANQNPTHRSNNTPAQALPIPKTAQPAPKAQPQATPAGSQLPNTLPPVPGDPGYQGSAAKFGGEPIAIPPAPASVDEALENAFNDKIAEKVEEKVEELAAPADEAKPLENDNPFSGLSLDDEFGPASKPAATAKPATTKPETPAADKPFSDEKSIELPMESEIPLPPEASPAKEIEDEIQEPAKAEVNTKMKLIAERGELRGLKGFCPVMLRDERDLKNALPEHHLTFKGRTYYFSSAAAKATFDEHPQQYAPISGGQDVVLLKEKVTKEGSLDHAVWFKDRLYLFTSQKTLEQFVATPKEFAISE